MTFRYCTVVERRQCVGQASLSWFFTSCIIFPLRDLWQPYAVASCSIFPKASSNSLPQQLVQLQSLRIWASHNLLRLIGPLSQIVMHEHRGLFFSVLLRPWAALLDVNRITQPVYLSLLLLIPRTLPMLLHLTVTFLKRGMWSPFTTWWLPLLQTCIHSTISLRAVF